MSDAASQDRSARVAGTEVVKGGEVKLVPGGPAELINFSETGALVEGKTRLHVGATVKMHIEGAHARVLTGRIVRCQVSAIHRDSSMSYQLGIAFDEGAAVDPVPDAEPATAVNSAPPATSATTEVPEAPVASADLAPLVPLVPLVPPSVTAPVEVDLVNEW